MLSSLVKKHGWYLAPMHKGVIKRNDDGTKTAPRFVDNWLAKGLTTKLELFPDTKPYLLLTGKKSGVIAIDCDNATTASMFLALDPSNPYTIHPLGKAGITLLYKYPKDTELLQASFAIHDSTAIDLDYLSDNRGMYLPSLANETKQPLDLDKTNLPELLDIPDTIVSLLTVLATPKTDTYIPEATYQTPDNTPIPANLPNITTSTFMALEPLVREMVDEKKVTTALMAMITPLKLRRSMGVLFKKQGFIMPSDIAKGGGSGYLLALSTILGGDESVNAMLYTEALTLLNSELQAPLDAERLENTIIKPMLNKSKVDGRRIWVYNKNWKARGLTLLDKDKNLIYAYIDKDSTEPMIVRYELGSERLVRCGGVSDCVGKLNLLTGLSLKAPKLNSTLIELQTFNDLYTKFGVVFKDGKKCFNKAVRSKCLDIILEPEDYEDVYKDQGLPFHTLDFLRHLIPYPPQYEYFISHLATKLKTGKLSPIVFNFIGIGGSGKDVMFDILSWLVGGGVYAPKLEGKQFLSDYNDYMEAGQFVLLSELGDTLTPSTMSQAKGTLKALSGSKDYTLTSKHVTAVPRQHNVTFIIASNDEAPPLADADDRRHVYIDTPDKLEEYVRRSKYKYKPKNPIADLVDKMNSEKTLLAYYLGTQARLLNSTFTNVPREVALGGELSGDPYLNIANPLVRFKQVIRHKDWAYLTTLMVNLESYELTETDFIHLSKSRLSLDICKSIMGFWGREPTTYQINKVLRMTCKQYRVGNTRSQAYVIPSLDKLDLDVLKTGFKGEEDEPEE